MIRVVLDINVIVSATIAPQGASRNVLQRAQASDYTLLISEGMIDVVAAKLRLPRIAGRNGLTDADIAAVVDSLFVVADIVTVAPRHLTTVTGDPEDDFVLATFVAGRAAHLVTGDRVLCGLRQHEGTHIRTPQAFLKVLEGTAGNG